MIIHAVQALKLFVTDLFEIIDRASAVLATLVLVHQYHTSEQEISLLVDISTMVLRSMDSEPAEGVLYLVNNVLEYHGYELTGAQTAQIFDDWSILCSVRRMHVYRRRMPCTSISETEQKRCSS
eukprot:TRINITY_DN11251_c0_g2_i7.p5 TRINITY_DN11251_c0_g2~~TRINITY_DN11251_c0_g2_i7.p5  ORF type:complete len:124 (+),score=21.60 TRINITY_DN11251_c0_g2_i7:1503-1874(+)